MVGPARQREAVRFAQRKLGVSERRACAALGVSRSTLPVSCRSWPPSRAGFWLACWSWSRRYPRYGYKRICKLLRREGWRVNRKRVHRLWKQGGPASAAKGEEAASARLQRPRVPSARRATHKNHVWTLDFAWDVTEQGRQLKFLPVVDEYTRECHAILVATSIRSTDVQDRARKRLFAGARACRSTSAATTAPS